MFKDAGPAARRQAPLAPQPLAGPFNERQTRMHHHSINEGKRLLAALDIDPLYLVDCGDVFRQFNAFEHKYLYDNGGRDIIAFYWPVLDALLSLNCLRYEWKGRGCCIVLRRSAMQATTAEVLGTLLHEAGHHVAACDRPERDDPDVSRAIKTSRENPLPESEHHNRRWLSATVHLWHRATAVLKYEIPLANVLNLEQYGYAREDLAPLLDEASQREGEPIESILRSSATAKSSATPDVAANRAKHQERREIRERWAEAIRNAVPLNGLPLRGKRGALTPFGSFPEVGRVRSGTAIARN